MEWFLMCSESEIPLRGVVIRSSYRELRDTTLKTYMEWFGDLSVFKEKDEDALLTIPSPSGKSLTHTLHFRAIQRPEETTKLQSMEVAFAFMEECVPAFSTSGVMGGGLPKAVMEICLLRLRQAGVRNRTLVLTANAPPPSHWYFTEFIRPTSEELTARNIESIFQPAGENAKNLPEGYYEELRARLDPDLVRRFIDGEVITMYDGEAVFPEARDHVHVVDEELQPIRECELILGHDFGLTPATLITQKLPNGRWLWVREMQSMNIPLDQHLEQLIGLMNDQYMGFRYHSWGDPAGNAKSQTDAKTCYEIAASMGFPIQAGATDWATRKESMKQRLTRIIDGKPGLLISRQGCPIAAEAILGAYRYPKARDGRVGYRPIKNIASHLMDAAQYIATREFRVVGQTIQEALRATDGYIVLRPIDPFMPLPKPRGGPRPWMSK